MKKLVFLGLAVLVLVHRGCVRYSFLKSSWLASNIFSIFIKNFKPSEIKIKMHCYHHYLSARSSNWERGKTKHLVLFCFCFLMCSAKSRVLKKRARSMRPVLRWLFWAKFFIYEQIPVANTSVLTLVYVPSCLPSILPLLPSLLYSFA